jgi:hypothetical protein
MVWCLLGVWSRVGCAMRTFSGTGSPQFSHHNLLKKLLNNIRTYALTKLHIDKSMSYNFQKSENHKISRC